MFASTMFLLGLFAAQAEAQITDYRITGDGPTTMLIIPCMSCRWRAFDTFMERNATRYRMFAVTVPGFGGSKVPDLPRYGNRAVWHENALSALKRFVDEHAITDAVVVTHSWGSLIGAQLLAEHPGFARQWIILDTHVPNDPDEQSLPHDQKLELVARWQEQSMKPLEDLDRWAAFNTPAAYFEPERRLLYHGMFMATPRDVVFQYWRENGLRPINDAFAKVSVPTLEVKSISARESDHETAKSRYLARYDSVATPRSFRTIFMHDTGHFQHEQRPAEIDRVIQSFVEGKELADVIPGNPGAAH